MNGATEHIEDLIGRYIVGEATEEQTRELREWCALSPDNQKYLDDAQLIFDRAVLPSQVNFDTEQAWQAVNSKINPPARKSWFISPIWGVAAGIAVVFVLSLLLLKPWLQPEEFQFTSENTVQTHLMPDLTEISLNQQSVVSVVFDQKRKTGTIQLQGEALISIPKDKKVQWTVQTGELLIEDIGTIFHVRSFAGDTLVEVSVQDGIVRFYTATNAGITLKEGEKGSFNKITGMFSKSEADINAAAFKTKIFQFQEEELGSITQRLEAVYGKSIRLEGPISSCKLTVTFDNEDLETILGVISETLNFSIRKEGNIIFIKGDGCY